jgi:Nucleotidyl transferase AbiEii toxin, Type IV TA system
MTSMLQDERILTLLSALDAEMLSRCNFHLGGGSRIGLELDGYRDSRNLDFLCSDGEGYADLRHATSSFGLDALFTPEARKSLHLPGAPRFDQLGIRFSVEIGGGTVGVELIREARIELDPGVRVEGCPVACLSIADGYAEKLLANSDRWADRQRLSRDLIDLSALRGRFGEIPESAWAKVEEAYRSSCRQDLLKALLAFLENEAHQKQCFESLQVVDPARILAGASQLLMDLEAPSQAS